MSIISRKNRFVLGSFRNVFVLMRSKSTIFLFVNFITIGLLFADHQFSVCNFEDSFHLWRSEDDKILSCQNESLNDELQKYRLDKQRSHFITIFQYALSYHKYINDTVKTETYLLPSTSIQADSINKERVYFGGSIIQEGHNTSRHLLDNKKRQLWIKNTIKNLQDIKFLEALPSLTIEEWEHYDSKILTARIFISGRIDFYGGKKLYVVLHSADHDPAVGDISFAMSDDGQYYINESHVCGSMIRFITHEKIKDVSLEDFIAHFYCDSDEMKWKKLDHNFLVVKKKSMK